MPATSTPTRGWTDRTWQPVTGDTAHHRPAILHDELVEAPYRWKKTGSVLVGEISAPRTKRLPRPGSSPSTAPTTCSRPTAATWISSGN